MTATPRYFALERMTVSVDGEATVLDQFAEIPESVANGDWIRRELRANRIAVMLMPSDDELAAALKRLGYKPPTRAKTA